jgi:hypothetical protein
MPQGQRRWFNRLALLIHLLKYKRFWKEARLTWVPPEKITFTEQADSICSYRQPLPPTPAAI